jgi:hypothetical protein
MGDDLPRALGRARGVLTSAALAAAVDLTTGPASAQSTSCTSTWSGNTLYTNCADTADYGTQALDGPIDSARRSAQALEQERAAWLARQQLGDAGITVWRYGKPVHYDYGSLFGRTTDHDVYMVANGQLHFVHAYAYADVGVAPDLSNVQAVTWMQPSMYGDPF